jgi:hypothetical protein
MPELIESREIDGVVLVGHDVHGDPRGTFVETWRKEWFPGRPDMVQANRSDKVAGTVVAFHYHLHQADYWYVVAGTVRVVLHDLRTGSPTHGTTGLPTALRRLPTSSFGTWSTATTTPTTSSVWRGTTLILTSTGVSASPSSLNGTATIRVWPTSRPTGSPRCRAEESVPDGDGAPPLEGSSERPTPSFSC